MCIYLFAVCQLLNVFKDNNNNEKEKNTKKKIEWNKAAAEPAAASKQSFRFSYIQQNKWS